MAPEPRPASSPLPGQASPGDQEDSSAAAGIDAADGGPPTGAWDFSADALYEYDDRDEEPWEPAAAWEAAAWEGGYREAPPAEGANADGATWDGQQVGYDDRPWYDGGNYPPEYTGTYEPYRDAGPSSYNAPPSSYETTAYGAPGAYRGPTAYEAPTAYEDPGGYGPAAYGQDRYEQSFDYTAAAGYDSGGYEVNGYGPGGYAAAGEYRGQSGEAWGPGGDGYPPGPRRRSGPWPELTFMTAIAVVAAAVILVLTGNHLGTGSAAQPPAQTVPNSSGGASGKGGAKAGSKTTSPGASRGSATTTPTSAHVKTTAPPSQKAVNLTISADTKAELVTSWLATNPGGLVVRGDVAGTVPGQVYYAYQPGLHTYWAVASFEPSAALEKQAATTTGAQALAQFQNSVYVFSLRAGPVWTMLGELGAGSCPGTYVPTQVLTVWGLCGLHSAPAAKQP